MLGSKIISFHHLRKVLNVGTPSYIAVQTSRGDSVALVLKLEDGAVLIYNDLRLDNHRRDGSSKYSELKKTMPSLSNDEFNLLVNGYPCCLAINSETPFPYNRVILSVYLLPQTFNNEVESFFSENKKLARQYGIDSKNTFGWVKYAYAMSDGSNSMLSWVLKMTSRGNNRLCELSYVMNWYSIYPQLSKGLNKKTITAYADYEIPSLIEELNYLKDEKRRKDAINMFNTTQKNLLKGVDNNALRGIMSKFLNLSTVKRINFIKKVSSIDNVEELIKQLKFAVSDHFEWGKSGLLEYLNNVESINADIVYDNGSVVVLLVHDFETMKKIAKTTTWCISKNLKYWADYGVGKSNRSNQYVIFNFSKKEGEKQSIIGVTMDKATKTITASHDTDNANLMNDSDLEYDVFDNPLNFSYFITVKDNASINGIMKKLGIDLSNMEPKEAFTWDKDYLFKKLQEIGVKESSLKVLTDKDGKMVIEVYHQSVEALFENGFSNIAHNNGLSKYDIDFSKYLIFADFNRGCFDKNRMFCAMISYSNCEDRCVMMVNSDGKPKNTRFLNDLLQIYEVPLDAISRVIDRKVIISEAFKTQNVFLLRNLGTTKDELISCLDGYDEIAKNVIERSIFTSYSSDVLDLIYSLGMTLSDIMGIDYISRICTSLTQVMFDLTYGIGEYGIMENIEKTVSLINNGTITNPCVGIYVSLAQCLIKIVKNEPKALTKSSKNTMLSALTQLFGETSESNIGKDSILRFIKHELLDGYNDKRSRTASNIVHYSQKTSDNEIKSLALAFVNN